MIHGYRLHQMQGNQIYGFRKSGYLLKKSEGKMRVKAWRKRRCEITDGFLFIYHSDETQPPTKLNLLTCQVKLVPGKEKKCFDLISFNRTYHFQVEDEHDITAWVYVLINCKEGALKKQFDDPDSNTKDFVDFGNETNASLNTRQADEQALHRLGAEHHVQQQLIRQVQALTGNDRCVDCSTTKDKPTWLSTNLGVLVCIECSGIHRDLGVHISRIQSLTLDNINTSQLLIAHNMGNDFFNEIFESKLRQLELLAADIASPNFDTPKLKPNSSMEQRCEFIKAKYIQKKFCQNIHRDDLERARCLKDAVISKDLRKLVQLFGEGFDIASCVSNLDPEDDDYHNDRSEPMPPEQHDCSNSNRAINQSHHHHHHHHSNSIQNCNHQRLQHHFDSQHNTSQAERKLSQHNSIDDSIDTTVYQHSKPLISDQDTSIHLALTCQASRENASVQFECDLFILDFIIQNSRAMNKQNALGETPLHYCSKYNLPECMKLLLKSGADLHIKNNNGETPLDLAKNLKPTGYKCLIEILGGTLTDSANTSASSGKLDTSIQSGKQNSTDSYLPSSAMKKIADEVVAYHAQSAEKKRHSVSTFKPKSPECDTTVNNPSAVALNTSSSSTNLNIIRNTPTPDTSLNYINNQQNPSITRITPTGKINSISSANSKYSKKNKCKSPSSGSQQLLNPLSNASSNGGSPIDLRDLPVPPPRRRTSREKASPSQPIRSKALYSCTPDNDDELGFEKGEIIAITSEQTADPEWWQGYIEGQPERRGFFPANFVRILHE